MPQHEEWKEKEKRKECTFSEERPGITAEEEKGINDDLLRDQGVNIKFVGGGLEGFTNFSKKNWQRRRPQT